MNQNQQNPAFKHSQSLQNTARKSSKKVIQQINGQGAIIPPPFQSQQSSTLSSGRKESKNIKIIDMEEDQEDEKNQSDEYEFDQQDDNRGVLNPIDQLANALQSSTSSSNGGIITSGGTGGGFATLVKEQSIANTSNSNSHNIIYNPATQYSQTQGEIDNRGSMFSHQIQDPSLRQTQNSFQLSIPSSYRVQDTILHSLEHFNHKIKDYRLRNNIEYYALQKATLEGKLDDKSPILHPNQNIFETSADNFCLFFKTDQHQVLQKRNKILKYPHYAQAQNSSSSFSNIHSDSKYQSRQKFEIALPMKNGQEPDSFAELQRDQNQNQYKLWCGKKKEDYKILNKKLNRESFEEDFRYSHALLDKNQQS
ncbi:UNKNOWN [Stylonychia lemnae]|uniref:Uncharacterized protein n=1 Tax=Stylonychia lemnae TaxID=5949 RepID=A0A078ASW2_STYLE|nr:UNKNOWN [Stylonychia lemnae]|eukprot:CDW84302.1 UNKNOWN [Stylonychia lemnae]